MKHSNIILLALLLLVTAYDYSRVQADDAVEVVMEPTKLHEDCVELTPDDVLHYSFEASRPVAFNIHYHEEENIFYPLSKQAVFSTEGEFKPEIRQYYCLMWTNFHRHGSVKLTYRFKIVKK